MKNKRFSIRRYLTTYMMIGVSIMTLLPAIWVYIDAKHEVGELFDASLTQSARVLHALINRESVNNNAQHLKNSLENKDLGLEHFSGDDDDDDMHEYEKKVAFQVWESPGALVLKSASAPEQAFAPLEPGFATQSIDENEWRTFTLYSAHDQWWLTVAERTDIRSELNAMIIYGHVWPVVLVTPLLALLLWYLIGRSLQPLAGLARQLSTRDYRDLSRLDDRQSPQETLSLVDAMNQLFARLNHAYQKESRFSGDAAHELRNPLASLMIHTENALEDNKLYLQQLSAEKGELQQHLQQQVDDLTQVKQGIGRLSHIVQQLLALSRAEVDSTQDFSAVDLAELCREMATQHQRQMENKSLVLEQMLVPNCVVRGNRPLLMSLLNNLLSNAISYTPEGGAVRLSCGVVGEGEAVGRAAFLQVEDSGPGIPAEELERVKDRFYRVTGNQEYGVGLGLSIVQAIIEQHEAGWEMGRAELGGLFTTVFLTSI